MRSRVAVLIFLAVCHSSYLQDASQYFRSASSQVLALHVMVDMVEVFIVNRVFLPKVQPATAAFAFAVSFTGGITQYMKGLRTPLFHSQEDLTGSHFRHLPTHSLMCFCCLQRSVSVSLVFPRIRFLCILVCEWLHFLTRSNAEILSMPRS